MTRIPFLIGIAFLLLYGETMTAALIIPASQQHAADIAHVHYLSWHKEFATRLPQAYVTKQSYDFLLNFWTNYLAHSHLVYVATVNDAIVGFIALIKIDGTNKEYDSKIDKIYIHPDFQGQGIGAQLVRYGLSTLHTAGHTKTAVEVWVGNTKGHKFYEHLGAVFIKDEEVADYHGTIAMKVFLFSGK